MTEQDKEANTVNWNHAAAAEMQQSPFSFDFFQAIRRLESVSEELPRLGHARQAKHEAVRILQTAALDFAPATIDRVDAAHDGRARLHQRFFGLLGPNGPMPLHMTELVRDKTRQDSDPTHEAFLNLFHHRMASLLYRAWSSSRGAIQRDRPDEDRFAAYVGALSGAMPITRTNAATGRGKRIPGPHGIAGEEIHWHFAGRFASLHRNAEGLKEIVSATVNSDVQVETFVLRNLRLQREDRTVLSAHPSENGRGGRLGQSAVLGRTVADRRSMIGVQIGPLPFTAFQMLLPGGSLHQNLSGLIHNYIGAGMDCRVRLILDRRTVPRMSLGKNASLGRSAWVLSKPPAKDMSESQFLI